MHTVSVAAAAQILLARVASNVGESLGAMLDLLAQEMTASVRIYGLDSRAGTYRPIAAKELRGACFHNGAAVLKTADGTVFTRMTVHRADFAAYIAQLDESDARGWAPDTVSAA